MRLRVIPITKDITRFRRVVMQAMVASIEAMLSPWMRGDSKISKSEDLQVPKEEECKIKS